MESCKNYGKVGGLNYVLLLDRIYNNYIEPYDCIQIGEFIKSLRMCTYIHKIYIPLFVFHIHVSCHPKTCQSHYANYNRGCHPVPCTCIHHFVAYTRTFKIYMSAIKCYLFTKKTILGFKITLRPTQHYFKYKIIKC